GTNGLVLGQEQDNVGDGFDANQVFQGQLDELQVWTGARTLAQIQADMTQKPVGNEAGLIGYWPFNEGSGSTAADRSPNGFTASLGGGNPSLQPSWVAVGPISVNLQGGTLTGTGVINGNLLNAAVVSPGSPTGSLVVNGTYTQTAAAALNVDLSGNTT